MRRWVVAVASLVLASLGCSAESVTGDRIDLSEIRARGVLRLLVARGDAVPNLPRRGWPPDVEREQAESFAHSIGVEPQWVYVDFDDLIPALLTGRGDLIVDNFTVTDERRRQLAFTSPVLLTREQLVTRVDAPRLRDFGELGGRRIAVRRSSSYWERLSALREQHAGLELEPVREELSVDEILAGVAAGEYDATLADANLVASVLGYRDDLRVAFEIEGDVVIAWALRPDATELRRAADGFLARSVPGRPGGERYAGDLPELQRRGVLRVLTRNGAGTYYVWRGQLVGFEYELVTELARELGLRLEIVVPPSRADLFTWLREGRGDLVAAGLTRGPERAQAEGVAFSRPYHVVNEVVVTRAGDDALTRPEDLAGRKVVVRRHSHYWRTLSALREGGVELELVAAPEQLETEEIIDGVADGVHDVTLADSHLVAIALAWRDDIRTAFPIGDPVEHAWAVRPEDAELLGAVNRFLASRYRGTFYNVVRRRYFGGADEIRRRELPHRSAEGLSPYDALTRRYAGRYGFDWRLVTAQMYMESRFDPEARSGAGAIGLMQLMPRTAEELGFEDLHDPETSIHAGVRYLAWVRDRFPERIPYRERRWFALAAYNAGAGHVEDARRLAEQRGWDRDRWFGHVERAMLLKRRADVASTTRYGYCRCGEPVAYVRSIRDRYQAYLQVADPASGPDREG